MWVTDEFCFLILLYINMYKRKFCILKQAKKLSPSVLIQSLDIGGGGIVTVVYRFCVAC